MKPCPMNGAEIELDGLLFRFIPRRRRFDCDVYRNGELVAELVYPKIPGWRASDMCKAFGKEALHLAKLELGE